MPISLPTDFNSLYVHLCIKTQSGRWRILARRHKADILGWRVG